MLFTHHALLLLNVRRCTKIVTLLTTAYLLILMLPQSDTAHSSILLPDNDIEGTLFFVESKKPIEVKRFYTISVSGRQYDSELQEYYESSFYFRELARIRFLTRNCDYSDSSDKGIIEVTTREGTKHRLTEATLSSHTEDCRLGYSVYYDAYSDQRDKWVCQKIATRKLSEIVFDLKLPTTCPKCHSYFPNDFKFCPYDGCELSTSE